MLNVELQLKKEKSLNFKVQSYVTFPHVLSASIMNNTPQMLLFIIIFFKILNPHYALLKLSHTLFLIRITVF